MNAKKTDRKKIYNGQLGIGLVEVIAALGLSVVVLTALVALSLFTLKSSLQSKLLVEGTKKANRELELVRAFRDSREKWYEADPSADDGFLDSVMGCYDADNACHMDFDSGVIVDPEGPGTDGTGAETLTRYFTATKEDGSQLQATDVVARITVVVSWDIAGVPKYARLYTDLTNWK